MEYESGQPFYGQHVGVLVFSTATPRIPGDAGHAASFAYPVCFEVVEGGFTALIEGSAEILESLNQAVKRLKEKGIRAVLGDCGMMSLYQDILGRQGIAVAASSLCQLPTIWQLIGRSGTIGIITGHAQLLGKRHLEASGWTEEISISIQGMEMESHFNEIVIQGGLHLDPERMREDLRSAVQKLKDKTPQLRAVVLECSNLATYSRDVFAICRCPVFDAMSAANLLAYSVNPPQYL